jgi:hypothetical protein
MRERLTADYSLSFSPTGLVDLLRCKGVSDERRLLSNHPGPALMGDKLCIRGQHVTVGMIVGQQGAVTASMSSRSIIPISNGGYSRGLRSLAASVRLRLGLRFPAGGTVTAPAMLRRLAAFPRQNGLAVALREVERLEQTLSRSIGSAISTSGGAPMPV